MEVKKERVKKGTGKFRSEKINRGVYNQEKRIQKLKIQENGKEKEGKNGQEHQAKEVEGILRKAAESMGEDKVGNEKQNERSDQDTWRVEESKGIGKIENET